MHHVTVCVFLVAGLEGCNEVLADLNELCLCGLGELALGDNGVKDILVVRLHVWKELLFKIDNLVWLDSIEVTTHTGEQHYNLVLKRHWHVLALLKELCQTHTTVKELLCGSIQIRTKLGKGGDLTVLGKLELHATCDLLHGWSLGSGTDTGHGKTDVNSRADTLVEQLCLEEDLTISNGNNVGWNVSGHITGLGLDDWEGSERARAHLVTHLSGTLEKTGVKVEDVTWVGLTTWRTAEKEGHLTVGNGLLGQIVKDQEGVLAVVTEELTHGGTSVWGEVLKRGGIRGCGRDNDGVVEGTCGSKLLLELCNGGTLLANGDVDAVKLLALVVTVVETLLVDDSINGDSGLTSLTITNDQLTLTTANWHKRVNGLDTGLHWLAHGLAWDDTWGLDTDTGAWCVGIERTSTINWGTKGIDDATKEGLASWDIHNGTGTLDNIALTNELIVTEHDDTDVVGLQVKGHTTKTAAELNHFLSLAVVEAVNTSDTITNGQHAASLLQLWLVGSVKNALLKDGGNLGVAGTSTGSRSEVQLTHAGKSAGAQSLSDTGKHDGRL
eukprot:m.351668 g.351668  ORF g.351668 m.351668 type:complete len:555 (-) comp16305_c0_seq1:37-1701(-)